MASITLTEEEQELPLAEWNLYNLGVLAQYMGTVLHKYQSENSTALPSSNAAAVFSLISACIDNEKESLSIKINGHEYRGVPSGNWEVVVRRVS